MKIIRKCAARIARNESGATAVEYGLIMALMTVALIGAIGAAGDSTGEKWDGISDEVGGAMSDAGT
ncbi:MAG: Flp family type IVb pilin [Pseudomonadota bacterium]